MARVLIDDKSLMGLWTQHASRVFAYISTLEPNRANVEDIFQETGVTVWEKRAEFTPGSDFRAWACRIAYFNVLSFRRRQRCFDTVDEELLELISLDALRISADLELRLGALARCLERLSKRNRQILDLRYGGSGTARQIAATMKLSVIGVYKSLQRIHEGLFDCIHRELAQEEH